MDQTIQEKIIKAISIDKKPIKQVAEALYMTENQLKILLKSWNVEWKQRKRFKPVERPDREELLKIYSEFKTVQAVAEHYATGYNTVMAWIKELKIPAKKMQMTDEEKKVYLEDHLSQLKNINF